MDDVVSASASLQEELENIHTLSEQYEAIAQTAQTQGEMNMSSGWFLKIWDTELKTCGADSAIRRMRRRRKKSSKSREAGTP